MCMKGLVALNQSVRGMIILLSPVLKVFAMGIPAFLSCVLREMEFVHALLDIMLMMMETA